MAPNVDDFVAVGRGSVWNFNSGGLHGADPEKIDLLAPSFIFLLAHFQATHIAEKSNDEQYTAQIEGDLHDAKAPQKRQR